MDYEFAARKIIPHVMYALAVSLFALLLLNMFFPTKRRRHEKRQRRK